MKQIQSIALQDGINAVRDYLESVGYSEDRKRKYEKALSDIAHFYESKQLSVYCAHVSKKYREDLLAGFENGNISRGKYICFSRTALMLDDYYEGKPFQMYYSRGKHVKFQLDDRSQIMVIDFETYLKGKISDSSIPGYISIARQFFFYLREFGIKEFETIEESDIIGFIKFSNESHPASMNNVCCAVRKILDYLSSKGYTLSCNSITCKTAPSRRIIQPAISTDDLRIILDTPDRSTVQGKRDYAVLLLASFTGLRAVDIANLRFCNFDSKLLTVNLIQHKTGTQIGLPIPSEVAEAINDYTNNGRPETDCDYIFLTLSRPYRKLFNGSSVRNILLHQLKTSSIGYTPHTGQGFHIFRRTIGSWLLGASADPEMISQVLGHRDGAVLKRYLPLAPDSMKDCALDFETVPLRSEVFR